MPQGLAGGGGEEPVHSRAEEPVPRWRRDEHRQLDVPQTPLVGEVVRDPVGTGVLKTIGTMGRVMSFHWCVSAAVEGEWEHRLEEHRRRPPPDRPVFTSPSEKSRSNSVKSAHTFETGFDSFAPISAASLCSGARSRGAGSGTRLLGRGPSLRTRPTRPTGSRSRRDARDPVRVEALGTTYSIHAVSLQEPVLNHCLTPDPDRSQVGSP